MIRYQPGIKRLGEESDWKIMFNMYVKLLSFAIFAICLTAVTGFPHRETLDCTGKTDGVYPDPDDNRGYYVCIDHLPAVHLDCKLGERYDDSFKTCVKDGPADDNDDDVDDLSMKEVSNPQEDIKKMKEELSKYMRDVDDDGQENQRSRSKYKVYNIQFKENVFPQSVVIIGKANREQKNK